MSPKLKNTLINISIIIAGVCVALGIFLALQNLEEKNRIKNLIPNANKALDNKEFSNAIHLFKLSEQEFPNDLEVKRKLAETYYSIKKYDESLSYFEKIKSSGWKKDDIHKVADIYFQKNDKENFIKTLEGQDIDPKDRFLLLKEYYKKDNLDKYNAELQKLLDYQEPLIYNQINEKDLVKVSENITRALTLPTLGNENIDLNSFKARIDDAQKQLTAGKKDFSELIQIVGYSEVNQCKFLFDRIKNLRSTFEKQKIPTFQLDYYEGVCFNQTEKADQAIPLLEKAITYDPKIIEYKEALAKSYYLKNDVNKVKETYDKILTIEKKSKHYENYAEYLYALKDIDAALTNYEEALKLSTEKNDQTRLAEKFLQRQLLDKKNLEACKRNDLLSLLPKNDNSMLIKGHCYIYSGSDLNTLENTSNDIMRYLVVVKNKDKNEVDKLLDKDLEGNITLYFKAVGSTLINK